MVPQQLPTQGYFGNNTAHRPAPVGTENNVCPGLSQPPPIGLDQYAGRPPAIVDQFEAHSIKNRPQLETPTDVTTLHRKRPTSGYNSRRVAQAGGTHTPRLPMAASS